MRSSHFAEFIELHFISCYLIQWVSCDLLYFILLVIFVFLPYVNSSTAPISFHFKISNQTLTHTPYCITFNIRYYHIKNRISENVTTTGLGPIIDQVSITWTAKLHVALERTGILDKSLGKTTVIGWKLDNL